MLALLALACTPTRDQLVTTDQLVQAAASVAESAGTWPKQWMDDHEAVEGETDTFTVTDDCIGNCGNTLPDWTGTMSLEVTWEGDEAGACACRGDCTSSKWTSHATGDLRVYNRLQGGCGDTGEAPDAGAGTLDVTVDLVGTTQIGAYADDEECELAPGTEEGLSFAGTLEPPRGGPVDVEVRIVWAGWGDTDFEVVLGGETVAWTYICGS